MITTFINTLISATLARGTSKTTTETATPSPVVIVDYLLADATNGALSLDFINVTNKSNYPIVMSVDFVIANDSFPDDVNNITVRITVTVTITENVATDVHAVLTAAQ